MGSRLVVAKMAIEKKNYCYDLVFSDLVYEIVIYNDNAFSIYWHSFVYHFSFTKCFIFARFHFQVVFIRYLPFCFSLFFFIIILIRNTNLLQSLLTSFPVPSTSPSLLLARSPPRAPSDSPPRFLRSPPERPPTVRVPRLGTLTSSVSTSASSTCTLLPRLSERSPLSESPLVSMLRFPWPLKLSFIVFNKSVFWNGM